AQVRGVVSALDRAGVEVIEVSHGDGLGGSSFNYGFSLVDEFDLIAAAVDQATRAKIAILMLPGLATVHHLERAHAAGASVARIATHCTEADVSIQHFGEARALGMETVGFLMLSHSASPEVLARQARIMTDAGAQCVYVVDSAGALILSDAQERVQAVLDEVSRDDVQVGFHGHQNLSMGIANSVLAYQAGARQIDGALCALGAGAGNSPTEVLAATFERMGIRTGIDLGEVLSAAEEVVRPFVPRLPWMDRASITQGYAGVYSSFLLHAERAAERYGVPAHEILQKVGEYGYVGGQEDMIIDIALQLAQEQELGDLAAAGVR
ncbi:MAG: 4-hydroxy-2-oxovalerate aldolase, partial [Actinomycetes bacterium]